MGPGPGTYYNSLPVCAAMPTSSAAYYMLRRQRVQDTSLLRAHQVLTMSKTPHVSKTEYLGISCSQCWRFPMLASAAEITIKSQVNYAHDFSLATPNCQIHLMHLRYLWTRLKRR